MNRYIKDNKIVIHPIINQIKTGQNIKNLRVEKGIKSQLKMYICGGIKMYNYSAKATQSLSL